MPPGGSLTSRLHRHSALQHPVPFSSEARGLFSHRRELLFLCLLLKAEAAHLPTTGVGFFQGGTLKSPGAHSSLLPGRAHTHPTRLMAMATQPVSQDCSLPTHTQHQPSFLLLEDFELGRRLRRTGSESLDSTSEWKGVRKGQDWADLWPCLQKPAALGGEGLGVDKKGLLCGAEDHFVVAKVAPPSSGTEVGYGQHCRGGQGLDAPLISGQAPGLRVTAERTVVLPGPEGLCSLERLLLWNREARGTGVRGQ